MSVKNVVHHASGRGAINLLEEAIRLLRQNPLTLLVYYLGTLPFVGGFLYFWADLSQGIQDSTQVVEWSLILTVLFVAMKCAHVMFAQEVLTCVREDEGPKYSWKDNISIIGIQTLIHSTVFVVWPVTSLLALPYAWVYAFYQYTSIVPHEASGLKGVWDKSWEHAKHWPKQNHLIIAISLLIYCIVFINVCALIFFIPYLLKTLFAIDSVFVLSGFHLLNTTFFASACALSYLLINPILRTVYVLRYFEGTSLRSGDDLKVQLRGLKRPLAALIIGILLCFSAPRPAQAAETLTPQTFNQSVDEVLLQREFLWRLPHQNTAIKDQGQNKIVQWMVDQIEKGFKWAWSIAEEIVEWFRKVFWNKKHSDPKPKDSPMKMSKGLLILIGGMILVLVIVLIVILKRKKSKEELQEDAPISIPDITSEHIKADDLLSEEWLKMGHELLAQGDFRHAVRAFYLGTISHMARRGIIIIKSYKSNYDYVQEVKRRRGTEEPLCTTFAQSVMFLNSVWYGDHPLQAQDVLDFAQEQSRIVELTHG